MTGLADDVRHGLRALARAPGFCALVLATLALGIGLTSAMFSVVYGVLYRPLPYGDAAALVRLWQTNVAGDPGAFPPGPFFDVQREAHSLAGVAAYFAGVSSVGTAADPARLESAEVTANFFDVLGVTAAHGRALSATADPPGSSTAVLSDLAWRQHFGGDPGIVGRTIRVDGTPYQVVGVMPPRMDFPRQTMVWRVAARAVPTPPLEVKGDLAAHRDIGYLDVVARLRPGVTAAQARGDLRVLAGALAQRYPADEDHGFLVEDLQEALVGASRPSLLLVFAAVGALLLIACTNLAGLLLARAVGRRRELAVRAALGAPRSRLARQLIVESLLLAAAGGALGLLLTSWTLDGVRTMLPDSVPRAGDIAVDGVAVLFALSVSAIVGVLFGTAPAFLSTGHTAAEALHDGGRTATGGRLWVRRGLVLGQVAVAVVLLGAAGVLTASLVRLERIDVGFTAEGVVTQQVVLPLSRYDRAAQVRFYQAVLDRLARDSRIAAASLVFPTPLVTGKASATVHLDRPAPGAAEDRTHSVKLGSIAQGYFSAMRIPFLGGRDFTPADYGEDATAIVVNQSFATDLLGEALPLGRRIRFGDADDDWYTVTGVVADARTAALDTPTGPVAYIPFTHLTLPFMRLVARGAGPDAGTSAALVAAVRAEDGELALDPPEPLPQLLANASSTPRFRSRLVAAFALLAIGLVVLGLYGLVSYTVSSRTREIATRLALGATPAQVRRSVLGEGLALTGAGLAIGLAAVAALGRLLRSLLYQTSSADPLVLASLVLAMAAVAAVACYVPARRAMRIEPTAALRAD